MLSARALVVGLALVGALVAPVRSCSTLADCEPEADLLESEDQYNCGGDYYTKVTLVTTGATNTDDGTFNSLAVAGARSACTAQNGCCLEVDMPVDGSDTTYTCELEYAATDSNLTIGVGFLHSTATYDAAACYGDKNFAIVDQTYDTFPNDNIEGLRYQDDEGGFLAGVMAGLVAAEQSSSVVGIISGPEIPPVKRFTTGFSNAVAEYCSGCTVEMVVCGDFGNGDNCGITAAQTLLAAGASVIFGAGGYTGSMGITYAAANAGTEVSGVTKTEDPVYVVGVDTDEYTTTFGSGATEGADKIITSALKDVSEGVQIAIGNFLANTAMGRNFLLNAANGGMGYAGCNDACDELGGPVTDTMTATVEAVYVSMASGQFDTRTDGMGVCTAGPGVGCPVDSDSDSGGDDDDTDTVGLAVGITFGLLFLFAACFVLFIIQREKSGNPVFSKLETPSDAPKA